jgi:diguanylate cyclase (GGDEF)-like protein/PAS domain S-box-containing protein
MLFAALAQPHQILNVGVLSFRPVDENQRIWHPLVDEVHKYNPNLDVNLTSGSLSEIEALVAQNKLDFVVVHPAAFVEMEYKYGITNIASLVRQEKYGSQHLNRYGGVIVTLSSRHDIHSLKDVRGKTIATTHKEAAAAMLMQQEEFSKVGIDILKDCQMIFTGMPNEKVLETLRSKRADIGFFRTGYIEELIEKGKLKKDELTVLNPRHGESFPYLLSTPLYPEWAVAATTRPSSDTVKAFTITLFQIHTDTSKDFHEFGIPLSNQAIRELMQKFHAYPFNNTPTFKDFIKENSLLFIAFFALLAMGSAGFTLYYVLSSRRIKYQLKQIETILATATDGIHVHDKKGNLFLFSDSFAQMHGYTREEIAKLRIYDLNTFFDPSKIDHIMAQMKHKTLTFETKHTRKNGETFDVEIHAREIDINGKEYIYASAQDITERKNAENKIIEAKEHFDYLAHHDPLTNLPNRLSLVEKLEIKTTDMEDHPFALFFLDLDGFKEINDSYGHRFGDQLLIRITQLLEEIFPPDTFIVRTGGDEFVILLSCQKDKEFIYRTMKHLIEILNHPLHIEEIDVYITAIIGIAMYPSDADNSEELLQKADVAMYNAKNMGKNTYSFYESEFTEKALQRTTLSTQLKKALQKDELQLYFQPQIDSHSGSIIGAETLLRWPTSEGMIPPSVFIPIAEESGLIIEVGKFVLMQGCITATEWSKERLLHGRVAINVSARQLTHIDFLTTLDRIIQETHCDPSLIELEITESSILENPEKIIALLWVIKTRGFNISIDDFGTGYSSLSYLKNLPIDKLKIDISFIRNITTEPKNQSIVKTIIALAKGLNMEVLAEGVETEDELEFLRANGIDSIQGYYYHKPMPREEIETLLQP